MSLVIRRHSLATPHFHGTGQGGVVVSRFDLITSKDYTVEVRNRFKGLDLIDRVPDEVWNEVRDIPVGLFLQPDAGIQAQVSG